MIFRLTMVQGSLLVFDLINWPAQRGHEDKITLVGELNRTSDRRLLYLCTIKL